VSGECRSSLRAGVGVLLLIAMAQEREPLSSAAVARMRLLIMHHRERVKKPLVSAWRIGLSGHC
jgi:hypothetical protein